MKQIFEGEVYEILPLSNGIIFSYKKTGDENELIVFYKMLSFETGRLTDITKNIYLLTKFGSNYMNISKSCENFVKAKVLLLPGGKVFVLDTDGSATLFDVDSAPIWQGSLSYHSAVPGDIALSGGALWASYPDCNVLVKYNVATMHEELRIGGKVSPFDRPLDIFAEGDRAIISNVGSKKLIEVNLKQFDVSDFAKFNESVYQYVESGTNRFALLESGLYLI